MKYLTINNRDCQLPTDWNDVSWGQFKEFCNIDSGIDEDEYLLELVVLFTGFDRDFWRQYTDIKGFLDIAGHVAGITQKQPQKVFGHFFEYEGKTYSVFKDLNQSNIGQYQDALSYARSLTKDEGEDPAGIDEINKVHEKICQIYLYPLVYDKYDFAKAIQMDIDHMRYLDISGWANFFLNRLLILKSNMLKELHPAASAEKKNEQDTKQLATASGSH